MTAVIAFSGSHGSGKTTLAHEVVAKLKKRGVSTGLVTEAARSSLYLARGDKSVEMHMEILALHITKEMQARLLYEVVICDRSIFDFITYGKIRFPELVDARSSPTLEAMFSILRHYKENYDLIFVTGGSWGNKDNDKLRSAETVETDVFDSTLKDLLTQNARSYHELQKNTAAEDVLEVIESKLSIVAR